MKNYIDFGPARCRDCYLCLKSCPVKAIRLEGHRARIIPERCIQCGTCTRVCPQNAISIRPDVSEVRRLLAGETAVVASVAPSFVSSFDLRSFTPMRRALETLGFAAAEETAAGAAAVTAEYSRLLQSGQYKNLISSACPAVNRMIQIYYPEALKYLAPVDSPMTAHAKMLKERYPGAAVVYIGPCIAQRREADETSCVDKVLTFGELREMLVEAGISFESPPARQAEADEGAGARCYPTEGGILRSFREKPAGYSYLSSGGNARVRGVLERIGHVDHLFLELSACPFSCVNGPCSLTDEDSALNAMLRVCSYAATEGDPEWSAEGIDFSREFPRILDASLEPGEEQLQKLLEKVGKLSPEDEYNCGSCGYSTCREKAWAAFNGYVDENLCVPFMRSQTESVSGEVVRRLPYGIVVLDRDFAIDSINRSAAEMLGIESRHPEGETVFDHIMIPEFIIAQNSGEDMKNVRVAAEKTGKRLELSIILMPEQEQILGVFKDVTEESTYNERLRELRQRTFHVTDEVVKKQMRIAQEIASLLGETTAETKVALLKLKDILRGSDEE